MWGDRWQDMGYVAELESRYQVIVPDLAVPKCASCGELVFDYLAEDQINTAFVKLVGARTPPTSSHQTSKD